MRIAQVCKAAGGTGIGRRIAYIFQSLFVAFRLGDVHESEISPVWLVGSERSPGFVQGVRMAIFDFMLGAVHQAADHKEFQQSSEAIIAEVLHRFLSPIAMHVAFLHRQGAGWTACSDAGMTAGKLHAFEFEDWSEALEDKGAKAVAQLFHDIYPGVHDEATDHSS